MKRIDAMVPNLKRKAVCEAIIKAGASGVTISESRGKGAGSRPIFTGAKGTARYVAEYSRTDTITTIVDDSKVDAIVKAVINSVHTGAKGDGKIFVSPIDETYDITTGQKGKV
ncbi:MAG: P-II family nitrogen regulator [Nitrosopumilus sp.]|jgi:nitrogen regulatory protein P-II 1